MTSWRKYLDRAAVATAAHYTPSGYAAGRGRFKRRAGIKKPRPRPQGERKAT